MAGAFIVFRDEQSPKDIHFKLASAEIKDIPEDQALLRDEVDRTLTVLRVAFGNDDKRFEEYFRPLLSLAQAGLVGEAAQPKVALRALEALKHDIVAREAGRIKNRYMKVLGLRALILGVPALLAALLVDNFSQSPIASGYLYLWAACMAGVWLSFGSRKSVMSFADLHILEEDRLEPIVRLVFAGLLTLIIGLLFQTEAVSVTLGSFSTTAFPEQREIALLSGALCGISELALSTKVASQASALLKFGE